MDRRKAEKKVRRESQRRGEERRGEERRGEKRIGEERRGEKRREEKRREEKSQSEKVRRKSERSQKKEDAGARQGRKVAKHHVFPMIFGSGESKRRLVKAAGAEPAGQMKDEELRTFVALRCFRVKSVKN